MACHSEGQGEPKDGTKRSGRAKFTVWLEFWSESRRSQRLNLTDVDASGTVVTVVTNLPEPRFLMMRSKKGVTSWRCPQIRLRNPTKNLPYGSFGRARGQLQPEFSLRTRDRSGNHDSHWKMGRLPEMLAALAEARPKRRTPQQGPREPTVDQESSLTPSLRSGTQQIANLICHESSHICQARHVGECKQGPLPTCSLTPDHHKR